MMETIRITIDRSEGILQRLIGLIERRGFSVAGIVMPSQGPDRTDLDITVIARDAARRIDLLIAQISRLIDVHAVHAPALAYAHANPAPRYGLDRAP